MAAAVPREQPRWNQPISHPESETQLPQLKLWNSLTRSKTPFIPIDPRGKQVTWYACGPTVYDDAHLGHARNYVSTDIIRRILRDYFKFDVRFIMNITDVDDKIITRGRQNHLFKEFTAAHPSIDADALATTETAFESYIRAKLPLIPSSVSPQDFQGAVQEAYGSVLAGGALDGSNKPGTPEAQIKMHVKTALSAVDALTAPNVENFYEKAQDVLVYHLDTVKGSSIQSTDYSIFNELSRKYEDRFMKDSQDLNILEPDEVTRVTEFMPEIVSFVEKIVKHNFGYVTSDGSVYFDISSFEAAGNSYARLEPWNRNDTTLQSEGEGSLTNKSVSKRSPADFALWKASKPGEPSWPSPWGGGRPGWHIECSAMASARLGKQMDIHSGGIDLAFPHHDNELAQSEAYWNEKCTHDQWVNYFLHMGHLSIQGSKMSKSLKNFTAIREALERGDWTPRGLRIVFLLGGWKDGIEITDDIVRAGNSWEEKVNNFFIRVKCPSAQLPETSASDELARHLKTAQDSVHSHLCDSFNTAGAMYAISELITNFYNTSEAALNSKDYQAVAKWVTSMVNIFGLNGNSNPDAEEIGWAGVDIPIDAMPYIFPLSSIRDSLRQTARSKTELTKDAINSILDKGRESVSSELFDSQTVNAYKDVFTSFCSDVASVAESNTMSKEILGLCDRLRDVGLFDLGIYLEDQQDRPARVRPVTRDLIQAREEAEAQASRKKLEREAKEKEAREKAERGKISPTEMFRTGEYSEWDEDGVPLQNSKGEEVTKSQRKKLRKEWERQKKAHEAWLKSEKSG
ncbi:hypothetical protein FQN57_007245 [Myotisia sp. PD_48]|nr:hypothetical protein FQN57_007245 [Myotisia sp. PD_48]